MSFPNEELGLSLPTRRREFEQRRCCHQLQQIYTEEYQNPNADPGVKTVTTSLSFTKP